MNTEQHIIQKWKEHVNQNEKFHNQFLKIFVGEIVQYVIENENEIEKNILYDFIEKRKSFTSKTKNIIMNYMKKVLNNQDDELELKRKFKFYIDLGSDTREKIANGVRKQIKKIYEIRKKEKQLIEKETNLKEYQEMLIKKDKEIALLQTKLEKEKNKNIKLEKTNKELYGIEKANLQKINTLQDKIIDNYKNEKLIEITKQQNVSLLEENKILKIQNKHNQ